MNLTAHVRRCPVCRRAMAPDSREMFCREKCRLVDLSRWLNEEYRIRGGLDLEEGEGTVVHSQEAQEDPSDQGPGDPDLP